MWLLSVIPQSVAQDATTKTTNLIRTCAPSENLRVKLQGQVGGLIAKKLAGAEASGETEWFTDGGLLQKLIDASPSDAVIIYKMYLDCIKPDIERYLEANISKGPTKIGPGDFFEAKINTSVDLFDGEYIFSVTGIRYARDKKTVWKVRTTLNGGGRLLYSQHSLGESARLKTKPCGVTLTGIDNLSYTFRFLLQCRK